MFFSRKLIIFLGIIIFIIVMIESLQSFPPVPEWQPIITEAEGRINNDNNPQKYSRITDKGQPMEDQKASTNNEITSNETSQEQDNSASTTILGETRDMIKYTFWLTVFTGVLAGATIILAISTCFLWYYSGQQSKDMKNSIAAAQQAAEAAQKSAGVAEKTLIGTQRPWIKIADMKLSGPTPIIFADDTIVLSISYQLMNIGTTPAKDVKFFYDVFIKDSDQDMIIFDKLKSYCIEIKGKGMGFHAVAGIVGYLFPNEMSRKLPITASVPISRLEKAIGREIDTFKSIQIIGYVTYKYPFDETIHITGALYLLVRKNGTQIFPPQKDDAFLPDGKSRQIGADKLNMGAIWYGYAD